MSTMRFVGFLAAGVLSLNGWGETIRWSGAGSDRLWSNRDNWVGEQVPGVDVTDVDVNLVGDKADAIVNDVDDLSVGSMLFNDVTTAEMATVSKVTLIGKPLTVTGSEWKAVRSSVSNECPLVFTKNVSLSAPKANWLRFAGDIESQGTAFSCISQNGYYDVYFYGSLVATNAELRSGVNTVTCHFYKPVKVKTVESGYGDCNGKFEFSAAGNEWISAQVYYWGYIKGLVANAFATNTVIKWKNNYAAGPTAADGWLLTANQTCDRIESDPALTKTGGAADKYNVYAETRAATLTLRGTADALCYAGLNERSSGKLSLVWDPVGDYVQDFRDRTHSMSGSITVNRGTLRSSGVNCFPSVTKLIVGAGAKIDVASTNDLYATFPAVSDVELLAGATCAVSVASARVFGGATPINLSVRSGGLLKLGDGETANFTTVYYKGAYVPAGSYSGVDGVPGATKAEWLEGNCTATVTTSGKSGVTTWLRAADGNWSTVANWSAGLPGPTVKAQITAEGADYTVTVDSLASVPAEILVGNEGAGTTTLSLASSLTFAKTYFEVRKGGLVDVPSSGNVVYKGDQFADEKTIQVVDGGEWRVSGGHCAFTNCLGNITIGSGVANSETGKLSMTSGSLYIGSKNANSSNRLTVFAGGAIDISGGTVTAGVEGSDANPAIRNLGGAVTVRGEAVWQGIGNFVTAFADGEVVFAGSARLNRGKNFSVQPSDESDRAVLTFRDAASIARSSNSWTIDGWKNGKTAVLNYDSSAVTETTGYGLYVARNTGWGELNVFAGLFPVGPEGLRIASSTSSAPTGTVRVTGGALVVSGSGATDKNFGWGESEPLGLTVGSGLLSTDFVHHDIRGLLEVRGGVVTNQLGNFIVGAGASYGRVLQTGGMLVSGSDLANSYRTIGPEAVNFIVGLGGGIGEVIVSNGTATVQQNVYIGGVTTNFMRLSRTKLSSKYPVNRHDAKGRLEVAGGLFVAKDSVILGADGEGELAIGGNGTMSVAKSLVLSNATASAVSFRAAADGFGTVTAKTLTITPGARLTVDVTGYAGEVGRFRLLTAETVNGAFADADITTVVPPGFSKSVKIRQDATGVSVKLSGRGIMIMFR